MTAAPSSTSGLSRSVKGSVVLVTGAGSGMGRATAELFAAEGAQVAVTDYDLAAAEAVAYEIAQQGLSARPWALDVADPDRIKLVVAEIASEFGGLDIVINNAGISAFAPIDSEAYDTVWARSLAVLLTSHQLIIRAALPHLRKSKAPPIVNTASTEALGATSRDSP